MLFTINIDFTRLSTSDAQRYTEARLIVKREFENNKRLQLVEMPMGARKRHGLLGKNKRLLDRINYDLENLGAKETDPVDVEEAQRVLRMILHEAFGGSRYGRRPGDDYNPCVFGGWCENCCV